MISKEALRDLVPGQGLLLDGTSIRLEVKSKDGEEWTLIYPDGVEVDPLFPEALHEIYSLALPKDRPSVGFYKHRAGDVYFVTSIGILDADGHGDPNAPRQVVYESTRSVVTGLSNIRTEVEFGQLVMWPDGVVRQRFVRMEYGR